MELVHLLQRLATEPGRVLPVGSDLLHDCKFLSHPSNNYTFYSSQQNSYISAPQALPSFPDLPAYETTRFVLMLLHEWVLLHFCEAHACLGILCKKPADEVDDLARKTHRELQVERQDLIVRFEFVVFGFEGCMSGAELVTENSDAPNIDLFVIELSLNDFGWHVVEGTAECLPLTALMD